MNDRNCLRLVVITQDDRFAIPRNIELLIASNNIKLLGCFIINSKSSLNNRHLFFANGFGLFQSAKMFFKIAQFTFLNYFYKLLRLKSLKKYRKIKDICLENNMFYETVSDINSSAVIQKLSKLNIDVIVSFSAPTIFKESLLDVPKFSCINLHCSLLPNYSGVMPSFWTIINNEEFTGCSIHTMDDQIDNGDLLIQEKVKISNEDTIYSLVNKTKTLGGILMLDALEYISANKELPKKIEYDENARTYFSWPTKEDFKEFKKKGKRLI